MEFFLLRIVLHPDWINLRIQSECRKIRTRKNSLSGHFSRSVDICNDKESPLICHKSNKVRSWNIKDTKEISYSRIRQIFKDYLSEITTTPMKFGLHSPRPGNNSILDKIICSQGFWSSEKARNSYIKDSIVKIINCLKYIRTVKDRLLRLFKNDFD